ncbi:MAG: DUF4236 domain-containing protein [Candidatus Bipolaricaulota bacterium]|nr:DUF4236 domain-containing protein [Candidatus Bipolaricaulota bacterium]
MRFRKSVKLAPGLRLNMSKSGMSLTAGPRGASVTFGKQGAYANVGVPGTGISVRQRLGASSTARQGSPSSPATKQIQIGLRDDGKVTLRDVDGNPLSSSEEEKVRRQQGDRIRAWLEERCEYWNQGIDEVLQLHLKTPSPDTKLGFKERPFAEAKPSEPDERKLGFLDKFSGKRRSRVEAQNAETARAYEEELTRWNARRAAHEEQEANRRRKFDEAKQGNVAVMESFLGEHLAGVEWPRETLVSYSVEDSGACVVLDVDLPEIEDMPRQQARVASRGFGVLVKEKSDAQVRKEYMTHIHAVAFRLVGETFAALPTVRAVVCSGYSQRPDPASGKVRDEYLYSVRVAREAWSSISFDNLKAIDPVVCLEQLGIRRKMSKTGILEAIEPLQGC